MPKIEPLDASILAIYDKHNGSLAGIAKELGLTRSLVWRRLKKHKKEKPVAGGSLKGVKVRPARLPEPGKVRRYIITSAQNNTKINEPVWNNLLALAQHYDAQIIVGTFSYNQNAFGQMAVKRGTAKPREKLWYDERLRTYFNDQRIELANGLVWCGEMNIIPTAGDPLSGLETYSHRKSAIFPHAKLAMRSVATMKGEGVKLNYTTGTITQKNYIQKKAGLVGEHHHIYGALIVEVNSDGNWWVRQIEADKDGTIYDLDVKVVKEHVTTGNRVEAINWGDIHATDIDPQVMKAALGEDGMLSSLRPKYQFMHDVLNGTSVNHHEAKNVHATYARHLQGFDSVEAELRMTAHVLWAYQRKSVKTVVVDANHDRWLARWLREHDYRKDPVNAIFYLDAQSAMLKAIRDNKELNLTEWSLKYETVANNTRDSKKTNVEDVQFLKTDEPFTICDGQIECGMHGDLGPNGSRGTPANLKRVGRRANTGHTHACGIYDGLYVAGTSTKLDCGYNVGPSSWSHSHVVSYPNGKRAIISVYAGKWRA